MSFFTSDQEVLDAAVSLSSLLSGWYIELIPCLNLYLNTACGVE